MAKNKENKTNKTNKTSGSNDPISSLTNDGLTYCTNSAYTNAKPKKSSKNSPSDCKDCK